MYRLKVVCGELTVIDDELTLDEGQTPEQAFEEVFAHIIKSDHTGNLNMTVHLYENDTQLFVRTKPANSELNLAANVIQGFKNLGIPGGIDIVEDDGTVVAHYDEHSLQGGAENASESS